MPSLVPLFIDDHSNDPIRRQGLKMFLWKPFFPCAIANTLLPFFLMVELCLYVNLGSRQKLNSSIKLLFLSKWSYCLLLPTGLYLVQQGHIPKTRWMKSAKGEYIRIHVEMALDAQILPHSRQMKEIAILESHWCKGVQVWVNKYGQYCANKAST